MAYFGGREIMPDGTYNLTFTLTDALGNEYPPAVHRRITVDTTVGVPSKKSGDSPTSCPALEPGVDLACSSPADCNGFPCTDLGCTCGEDWFGVDCLGDVHDTALYIPPLDPGVDPLTCAQVTIYPLGILAPASSWSSGLGATACAAFGSCLWTSGKHVDAVLSRQCVGGRRPTDGLFARSQAHAFRSGARELEDELWAVNHPPTGDESCGRLSVFHPDSVSWFGTILRSHANHLPYPWLEPDCLHHPPSSPNLAGSAPP